MKTLKVIIMVELFSVFGCGNNSKNSVYLSELPNSPEIVLLEDKISITVENSIKNSSKSICTVKCELLEDCLFIKAYQKLSKLPFAKYNNQAQLKLTEKQVMKFRTNEIKYYWIDPNGDKKPIPR